ncbi:hypothetical protein ABID59_005671 [Bradyrhizobium sp. S3.3.6]|uniref:hypothetical protein n=1 Tax=unclassified Bradyrhizobium TaxID=2631580 RepID=UPI003398C779
MRNISLLAWTLTASAAANVITMLAVLYIAFGTPNVRVRDGYVKAGVDGRVAIKDTPALRVEVTRMP